METRNRIQIAEAAKSGFHEMEINCKTRSRYGNWKQNPNIWSSKKWIL
jgi:hypothetical protein